MQLVIPPDAPSQVARQKRSWPILLVAALGGLLYLVGSELGHWLSLKPQHFATFWPANGLYLAFLLTHPPSRWPALVAAALLGNLLSDVLWHERSIATSWAYGVGNSLEVILGAWLLRRYSRCPFRLRTVSEVLDLLLWGALLSPMLGATIGVATTTLVYGVPFWTAWPLWWIADATGILLAAPLALLVGTWSQEGCHWPRPTQLVETIAIFLTTAVVAYLMLTNRFPFTYIVFPLVLWAGLRRGVPGVLGVITLLAFSVARATAVGQGIFADAAFTPVTRVLFVQAFLGILALSGLLFGATVSQWRQAQSALQQANDNLEEQVIQRTAALRRSEEQHRLALEAAQLGTWYHDMVTGHLHFDATARAHHGFEGDISLATILTRAHPEDRPQLAHVIAEALDPVTGSGRSVVTYRILHPDGTVRWLDIHTYVTFTGTGASRRPLLAVGTSQDITERTLVEAQLREREERYRVLTETVPSMIYETDALGNNTFSSEQWQRFSGLTPEQIAGSGWRQIVHPDDLPSALQQRAESLRTASPYEHHRRFRCSDGTYRWMLVRNAPVRDASGTVVRWVGSITDVDALIRAEQALQTLNAELEQRVIERTQALSQEIAERQRLEDSLRTAVAEKDLLLKEIHHRVKNNMQMISSILQLQSTAMATPQLQNVIQECRNRVRTMALIHEQLYSTPSLTTIASDRYLHELVDMLRRSYAQPHIRWLTEVEALPLDIETAIPLGLIANELIANAFKHAFPDGRPGTLTVRLQRHSPQAACLTVQDDGIGLLDGQLAGTTVSLGLRMVQALVRQLDATIESRSGDGTTIDLVFPLPLVSTQERPST